MIVDLNDEELEIVQYGIADLLSNLLVRTPDIQRVPEWRARFDAIVGVGRKLGMEL